MDILLKSKKYPDSMLLLADLSNDSRIEELTEAIAKAKKEYPWLNTIGSDIELKPATLVVTTD